jgi:hypothetical protein
MYFKTLGTTYLSDDEFRCYALALIPKVDNIVVVGSWEGNNHPLGTAEGSANNYDFNMRRAFIFQTTSDLRLTHARYWFQSDTYMSAEVIAYDVATSEADGSIYITGSHSYAHTRKRDSRFDCFVIKLDGQLNKIFAKSFGFLSGATFNNIYCTHI